MRTRIAASTAAVMLGSVVLATAGASPAAADSARILSIESASELLADGVHQRLLINDKTAGQIVAAGYNGTVLGRYLLAGVSDLALSRDSTRLYAAVQAGHKIVELDPVTLVKLAEYDLGATNEPSYLAPAGGKIWFSYRDSDYQSYLGSLDVAGDAPEVVLGQGKDGWGNPPRLATASGDPNRIAANDMGQNVIYDVADGTPQVVAKADVEYWADDLALSPDGQSLATMTQGDYYVSVRRTSDLQEIRQLPFEPYPKAVDYASDGTLASGTSSSSEPDVHVYTPDTNTLIRRYNFPASAASNGDDLTEQGLAWEPGGNRLFALSEDWRTSAYTLRVYTEPRKSPATLSLTGPATGTRGKALTISGTLKSSIALPAGTPVTVTRTDIESPAGKSLGTRTINASGGFSVTDTPTAGGTVSYRVGYAGDATHAAVTAVRSVAVARATTSLTINNNGKVYGYGATATFTAHLGATYKNRVVEIWADPSGGDQGRRLLKKATVNSKGNVSAALKLTRNTAVQAVFAGDGRSSNRTVTSTVYAKTKVSLKLSKYYKTGKIGGTSYRYYRKNVRPYFTVALPKYPKRKPYLRVDIWFQGRWRKAADAYVPLDKNGRYTADMATAGLAGYRFRVRAGYVKGSSGDSVNYTTYTPYQYFYVSK